MQYNRNKKNSKFKIRDKYIFKIMITIVLTLTCLILIKSNNTFKTNFYKYVYEKNFSFSKINNLYNKYIGSSLPFKNTVNNSEIVFKEKLTYKEKHKYRDGVKLTVTDKYLVPVQKSGIVVYIGQKEGYENVVIVQQVNGIDMWYGNIDNVNVKLYDYIKEGSVLGECDKYLYILYKKDGKVLNYEDYI